MSTMDSLVIALEDIEAVMEICFRFSGALFQAIDRFSRHETFDYNVGLRGLGHRQIERNPQPRNSSGISMGRYDVAVAFPKSRRISRAALTDSRSEIDRTVVLLQRNAGE